MLTAGESETVEFKRILNGFKEYGLPTPEFREMSSGFMVTVFKKTEQVAEQVTEQVDTGAFPIFCKYSQKNKVFWKMNNKIYCKGGTGIPACIPHR